MSYMEALRAKFRREIMEYMLRTEKDLRRLAEGNGLYLKLPKKNELFIDLDSVKAQDLFWERYDTFIEMFPIRDLIIRPSKSGPPHLHVTVVMHREVTDMERVALQAILGSDPKREMLAVKNNGIAENATVFFEVRPDETEEEKYTYGKEEAKETSGDGDGSGDEGSKTTADSNIPF